MSEMEEKLGAILNNPQLMQQIMSMAQAMGNAQPPKPSPGNPPPPPPSDAGGFDPKMLQSLAGIAGKSNIDQNQKALLQALCPYLSRNRIGKLERAMRAARMAGAASTFLNSGGLQLLTGR